MEGLVLPESVYSSNGMYKPGPRKKREMDIRVTLAECSQLVPSPPEGSAVLALQSKVKALSEKRSGSSQVLHKKHHTKDRKTEGCPAPSKQLSSDEEVDPELQVHTYLTDKVLKCRKERGLGEGASLENLHISNGGGPLEEWTPPRGFWKATRNETRETDLEPWPVGKGYLGRAESWESLGSASSVPSLSERVEMNRGVLRQILSRPPCRPEERQEPRQAIPEFLDRSGKGDSDWDSGISLQDCDHRPRAFLMTEELPLSPRHEQAKRLLERARMKARAHPLRADHSILPFRRPSPDSNSRGGVQARRGPSAKEFQSSGCGNLSDSSSGDSSGGPKRRQGQSPTRVRFEDESEQEAEVRYLERRRVGGRGHGLLVSKPDVSLYTSGGSTRSGKVDLSRNQECAPLWNKRNSRRAQEGCERRQSPGTPVSTISDGNPKCNTSDVPAGEMQQGSIPACQAPEGSHLRVIPCWVPPSQHKVRTDYIKESYIGEVTIVDDVTAVGQQLLHGNEAAPKCATPSLGTVTTRHEQTPGHSNSCLHTDNEHKARPRPNGAEGDSYQSLATKLPTTPGGNHPLVPSANKQNGDASPEFVESRVQVSDIIPKVKKSSLKSGTRCHPSRQRVVQVLPSLQYRLIHLDAEDSEPTSSCSEENFHELTLSTNNCNNSHLDARHALETGTGQSPFIERDDANEHSEPTSAQWKPRTPADISQRPSASERTDTKSRSVLKKLLSAIGHSSTRRPRRGRSNSLSHMDAPVSSEGKVKKTPSLQSLQLASPFSQLKKSPSSQSLLSAKSKPDRSRAYQLGETESCTSAYRGPRRSLSVEDVGSPSAVRSVGRVAQAFPDGTFLLELSRPVSGTFGFLICRGVGRTDSGVYVEEMSDAGTRKLYAGLLGVGDEILEVNGEKVSGLTLEEVNTLMLQRDMASIRVLRQR
ncbi:uncharacterized protein KIAA1614-like isoform X2 [Polypterus senegalus]|uniref:uncharacterized protein KIAA1614-like isoform X2 n=1 Tax=Polypterus senegalus TaxID=55291 RepID=UPI001964A6FB|nr:uncharacterized protein KIAA1614-like isoform X2 [Polypterus senegalus]